MCSPIDVLPALKGGDSSCETATSGRKNVRGRGYMETAAFVKKITDIMIASGDNLEQSAGKIGVSRKAYRMR